MLLLLSSMPQVQMRKEVYRRSGSHGGFITAWLVTQDSRFAAAVPLAPVTRQGCRAPDRHYTNPNGKYFKRSPIMHAHKAKTPTLNICSALDRCTPAEEASQFHNALGHNVSYAMLGQQEVRATHREHILIELSRGEV